MATIAAPTSDALIRGQNRAVGTSFFRTTMTATFPSTVSGVARSAYEAALEWAKSYTAGGPHPIIHYQNVGYVLGDVAARIEACRYFCWKTAHYMDRHDYHGELIGAMCKIHCTELLFDAVYKCMQVVGVNSADKQHLFEKYLREAAILPIYDAGNFGMQRRRVHGVLASPERRTVGAGSQTADGSARHG